MSNSSACKPDGSIAFSDDAPEDNEPPLSEMLVSGVEAEPVLRLA